jgi:hypothetical protein
LLESYKYTEESLAMALSSSVYDKDYKKIFSKLYKAENVIEQLVNDRGHAF